MALHGASVIPLGILGAMMFACTVPMTTVQPVVINSTDRDINVEIRVHNDINGDDESCTSTLAPGGTLSRSRVTYAATKERNIPSGRAWTSDSSCTFTFTKRKQTYTLTWVSGTLVALPSTIGTPEESSTSPPQPAGYPDDQKKETPP